MVCVAIRGLYLLSGYRSRLTNHEEVTTMNNATATALAAAARAARAAWRTAARAVAR